MKPLGWILGSAVLACAAIGLQAEPDLERSVRTYIYRPAVFADRRVTVGLPADRSALADKLWYIRLDESVRALTGMAELSAWARRMGVPGLDFNGHQRLTDADVETLLRPADWTSAATPLYLLRLRDTQITDRAISTINRLFELRVLELGRSISDRGVQGLQGLRRLTVLALGGARVTDAAASVLASMTSLRRLSLAGTKIGDAGIERLKNLPLRQLDLGGASTDRSLALLANVGTLEHLDAHAADISQKGLTSLASLPSLHTLFLGPSIHDDDLAPLGRLKGLRRLDLRGAKLTDLGAHVLADAPQLEELALTDTQITSGALAVLVRLPYLRYLEISGTPIQAKSLEALTAASSLQVLSFSTDRRLTAADLKPLASLPRLHAILVNGVLIGPDLINVLRAGQAQAARPRLFDLLLPYAHAEGTEADVNKVLEVASLPQSEDRRPFAGFHGLKRIHEAESTLNDVIPAMPAGKIKAQEETQENFLGEFTVQAGAAIKIR